MMSVRTVLASIALALGVGGCGQAIKPIPPVSQVEIDRFMGDWYVLAHIPAFIERKAYNAIESYKIGPDGEIQTTFRFRKGAFDGALKTYTPVGTVEPGTGNAIWGMQFIWPINAEYVIVDLDDDYQNTIIGRTKRDYVWVMSRQPSMDAAAWTRVENKLVALGYSLDELRRVPQRWPETDD